MEIEDWEAERGGAGEVEVEAGISGLGWSGIWTSSELVGARVLPRMA